MNSSPNEQQQQKPAHIQTKIVQPVNFSQQHNFGIITVKQNIQKQEQQMPCTANEINSLVQQASKEELDRIRQLQFGVDDLDLLVAISSENIYQQHYAIIGIRKLLDKQYRLPIKQIINTGVVPKLMQFARQSKYPQLQTQSVWALSCIASGRPQQVQVIVNLGAIPLFAGLLLTDNMKNVVRAALALEKILGDWGLQIDQVLQYDGLRNLIQIIRRLSIDKSQIDHQIYQTIAIICRNAESSECKQVKEAIEILSNVVVNEEIKNKEAIKDCLWAIYCRTFEEDSDIVELVVKCGIIPALMKNLKTSQCNLVIPSLKIINNIIKRDSDAFNAFLALDFINKLASLLLEYKKQIRQSQINQCILDILITISEGNQEKMDAIVKSDNLKQVFLIKFRINSSEGIRICHIFGNLARSGCLHAAFDNRLFSSILQRYFFDSLKRKNHTNYYHRTQILQDFIYILTQDLKLEKHLINLLRDKGVTSILQKLQCSNSDTLCDVSTKILEIIKCSDSIQ